jgi:hypothetical protein
MGTINCTTRVRGWMLFFRVSPGLILLGLTACGAQSDPGSDSTTHFWQTCIDDAECGTLEQCFCGRCTRECRDTRDCSGSDVECVATGTVLTCAREFTVCAPQSQVPGSAVASVDASVSPFEEPESAIETTPVNGTAESGTGADVEGAQSGSEADVEGMETAGSGLTEAAGTEFGAETSSLDAPSTALVDPADEAATSDAMTPTQGDYIPLGVEWWRWASDKTEAASDCTLLMGEASAASCAYSWQCAERNYGVECHAEEDGSAYSCYCNNPTFGESGYFAYLVPTDAPTSACPAAFEACTTAPQPGECHARILPPEETEVYYRCQWVSECTTATSSGLEVAHLFPRRGQCSDENGTTYCGCEGLNLARGYMVSEAEGAEACELAAAACDADELPAEWYYPECTNSIIVDSASQCFVGRDCPIVGDLSSRVSALARLAARAQCYVADAGDLTCTCSNAHGTLNWAQPGPMGVVACSDALDLCERAQEIEFSVPACAPMMRENTATSCSETYVCTSSGELDGETLLYTNYLAINCNSEFDGWRCACQAGEKQLLTLLDASLTPEQACEQYMNTCELELTFTPDLVPLP